MSALPRVAVIGFGDRGLRYARLLAGQGLASIVAVADPSADRRALAGRVLDLDDEARYADWRDLLAGPIAADAVLVATRDHDHFAPTVAAIDSGHHVLVEKPMAATEAECVQMVEAAERAGVVLAVCHVLRYTRYTGALMDVLHGGLLGDVISVEHLEPVGWWHQAHSYVRGNWRREDESTFMLMAKSVHDLDWLGLVVGRPARRVSSFGSLTHFRPEHAPPGAGERCVDCAVEPTCPYSAPRLYLGCLEDPDPEPWPLSVVTSARTRAGVLAALETSPYGRCVYRCDNDVVDHQVVSIEYEGGATASFTMTAFTRHTFRQTRVFGSHGCLSGDGRTLTTTDFRTGERAEIEVSAHGGPGADAGHGGGDEGLVRAFAEALRTGRPGLLVPARDSLASHQLTFAAERARRTSSVVHLDGADQNTHNLTAADPRAGSLGGQG